MFYTADDAKSLTFNKIKASIPQDIIDRVHATIEQAIANKQFCCIIEKVPSDVMDDLLVVLINGFGYDVAHRYKSPNNMFGLQISWA